MEVAVSLSQQSRQLRIVVGACQKPTQGILQSSENGSDNIVSNPDIEWKNDHL